MMKKTIRIMAAALLLVLLGTLLTGCRQLDELKRNHGVFLDESREEIELRGHVYEKIQERVMFGNTEDEPYLITDEWSMNVTEKDVPLLLSSSYGEAVRYNSRGEDDPVILSIYDYRDGKQIAIYYCREDFLDTLKAKIDHVELDQFYHVKMTYSEVEEKTIYQKTLIPEKTAAAIRKTIERAYDTSIDLDPAVDELNFSDYKDLQYTDKDLLFTNDSYLEICRSASGEYYIFSDSSKGTSLDGVSGEWYWKKVAAEDKALFDELFLQDYVEEPLSW